MAVRFDLVKYQQVKQAYLAYIQGQKLFNTDMLQSFAAYMSYLDVDEDVRTMRQTMKSKKDSNKKMPIMQTESAPQNVLKTDTARPDSLPKKRRPIEIINAHNSKTYVGRVNNLERRALSISTKADADAFFNKILRQRPALSVNELTSAMELCKRINDESLSRYLISIISSLHRNAQETIDKNTKVYIDKLHRKPRNPELVRIIYTPQGGQNKRY